MDRGWVKLWRKSTDSSVWPNADLWRTWCCCLFLASHKESWVAIDGVKEPIRLDPGQFISGRYAFYRKMFPLQRESDPTALTTWRWLQKLQKLGNVTINSNTKYSVITINNWHTYQGSDTKLEHPFEQPMINRRTPQDQPMCTNKNVKNLENYKTQRPNSNKKSSSPINPGKYGKQIDQVCKDLKELPPKIGKPFDPVEFVNLNLNRGAHPGAILETLAILRNSWDQIKIGPLGFAAAILREKNGNWNEQDEIEKHNKAKNTINSILKNSPSVKKLVVGIGNE